MPDIKQLDNGGLVIINETDGVYDLHVGGPATASVGNPRMRSVRVMQVPLAILDTSNGGMLAWQNSNTSQVVASPILVTKIELNLTTAATSSCAVSVGQAATQVISSNLIDSLNTAVAGVYDNVTDKGAGGKTRQKVAVGEFITATKITGSVGGMAGMTAYIHFYPLS